MFVLKTNPYKLAEDITGIGFRAADAIAAKAGIAPDSDFRVCAAILYSLHPVTTIFGKVEYAM